MLKALHLNTAKLDSFRILIPLHELELNPLHHTFLNKVASVNIDGELLQDFVEKKNYYDPNAEVSFTYNKARVVWGESSEDVIKIGISAKCLRQDYLQGITEDNIHLVLKQIQEENIITNMTIPMLLKARIYDVDLCVDIHLGEDLEVADVVSMAHQLTIPKKDVQVNVYNQQTNRGIQWGFRNKVGKAYKQKQFLKYYDKVTELINNSDVFYDKFLKKDLQANSLWKPNKILRSETTIKNPAHFNSYGLSVKTLGECLSLLKNDIQIREPRNPVLQDIYYLWDRPIQHYMSGRRFLPVNLSLTPMDLLIWEKWNEVKIEHQAAKHEDVIDLIVSIYTTENHTKHQRYNFKKQLLKILAKFKETEYEALAKDKGGQYEMIYDKGLTPHHDSSRTRTSPLKQVVSTDKNS